MSIADTRFDQMYPVFTSVQVETVRRFASGEARKFTPGEPVHDVGTRNAPAWLVLEGELAVARRDGLHRESSVVSLGPGQFSGEISQLAGQGTLSTIHAGPQGCTAIPFDPAHIRALVVGTAEIGEMVMRAFILRRIALIQDGGAGSLLIDDHELPHLIRLQDFLSRNGYPHSVLDASRHHDARAVIERLGVLPDELPLMVCANGMILKRPTEALVAAALGITPDLDPTTVYDVAIVGAGPAGLAAAVYAASEGLSVIVLDERAFGGQAGASARIENYLGFPTGISGLALAARAFTQAQKFGAEIAIPLKAVRLDCNGGHGAPLQIDIGNGDNVQARTVVIASGARYRRPEISNLSDFENAGISYWASPVEAKICEGEEIALVGGGNSAGQAVVFLAPAVKRLHLVVRSKGLEASMSRYLIDRIGALPNVAMHVGTEIVALEGDPASGLTAAVLREKAGGNERTMPLRHIFLFVGAEPNVGWLDGCVALDNKGFVLTGAGFSGEDTDRQCLPLETSIPGVFAIGDVRASSTKRVGAAIGEGAAVVTQIHQVLGGMHTRAAEKASA